MANYKEMVSNDRTAIIKAIEDCNKALKSKKTRDEFSKLDENLKLAEAAYTRDRMADVIDELAQDENPVKTAILMRWFPTLSHRRKMENGTCTGYVLVEENDEGAKKVDIDLEKLFEKLKKDTSWRHEVSAFNCLLTLRVFMDITKDPKPAQMQAIRDSYAMHKLVRKVEVGETPTSNTKMCSALQKIVNAIYFEDNGNGENVYKVYGHDIAYLRECYTTRSTNLSVRCANDTYLKKIIYDVLHSMVAHQVYTVRYKTIKAKAMANETKKVSETKENATAEKVSTAKTVETKAKAKTKATTKAKKAA